MRDGTASNRSGWLASWLVFCMYMCTIPVFWDVDLSSRRFVQRCRVFVNTDALCGRGSFKVCLPIDLGYAMPCCAMLCYLMLSYVVSYPAGDGVVPIEFAVELEHRACNTLDRLDVVNAFAEPVPKPPHKVNLTKPHKTILVQLIRNVCGVCVIDCYKELSKLNVRKAAEDAQEEAVNKAVTAAASGNDTQAAGCTKQQQQQPAVDQQQQEQQQEGSTQPAE